MLENEKCYGKRRRIKGIGNSREGVEENTRVKSEQRFGGDEEISQAYTWEK